jgi:DNA-binding protein HU-beta
MNKKELVDELAERFDGNRKVAEHALESVLDVIGRSLSAGEKVAITGFGAFERKVREVGGKAEKYVPEFKPGKDLTDVVNGARDARERVAKSLAVVPATAAQAAAAASQTAAAGLRAAADKARAFASELAERADSATSASESAPGPVATPPAKKAPAKKTAAKKSAAKKAPAKRQSE